MPSPLKFTNGAISQFLLWDFNGLSSKFIPNVFPPFHFPKTKNDLSVSQNPNVRFCLNNGDIGASDLSNSQNYFPDQGIEGLIEKDEHSQRRPRTSNKMLEKLRRYGLSGILSYGLLNTAYYLPTFLFVWFYIAPSPGRMGYVAAAGRFLKIMATVWAGSQVTKLARIGGAVALAPFVDRGLSWFTDKYNFESQGKAFMVIVGFCLGLGILTFIAVTLLSA